MESFLESCYVITRNLLLFFNVRFLFAIGVISIVLFALKRIKALNKVIEKFDKAQIKTVLYVGFIWLVLTVCYDFLEYYLSENETKELLGDLIYGKYAPIHWAKVFFSFLLSQSFRIRYVKKYLLLRIIISLLLFLGLEKIYQYFIYFHRDYLPSFSSFGINFTIGVEYYILEILVNITVFLLLTFLFILFNKAKTRIVRGYKKRYS